MQPVDVPRATNVRQDPDSEGYWQHLAAGRLALQQCDRCARYQFPPLERCRYCAGVLHWHPVQGGGTVHTFIVQHHDVIGDPARDLPYAVGLILPDEAPELRIPAAVVPFAETRIGDRVQAEFVPTGSPDQPMALRFRKMDPSTES